MKTHPSRRYRKQIQHWRYYKSGKCRFINKGVIYKKRTYSAVPTFVDTDVTITPEEIRKIAAKIPEPKVEPKGIREDREKLEAIQEDPWSVTYIKKPSKNLILEAIKQNPRVIREIKGQIPESIQLEAIRRNPYTLKYLFDNKISVPKSVQLEAIELNSGLIRYIPNPSEQVQLIAVQKNPSVIRHIDNPTETVKREAVKINPSVLIFIPNPSEQVQLEAVRRKPRLVFSIPNPSESAKIEAERQGIL